MFESRSLDISDRFEQDAPWWICPFTNYVINDTLSVDSTGLKLRAQDLRNTYQISTEGLFEIINFESILYKNLVYINVFNNEIWSQGFKMFQIDIELNPEDTFGVFGPMF